MAASGHALVRQWLGGASRTRQARQVDREGVWKGTRPGTSAHEHNHNHNQLGAAVRWAGEEGVTQGVVL